MASETTDSAVSLSHKREQDSGNKIRVPPFYNYLFTGILVTTEIVIIVLCILYRTVLGISWGRFVLNLAVFTGVTVVVIVIAHFMIRRAIIRSLVAEEALRNSEERYRSLYTSMNEGAALHEITYNGTGEPVDYTILDMNRSYESIIGMGRVEAIGRRASELYGVDRPPYLDICARVASTGEPASFEAVLGPDKRTFIVSVFSPSEGQFATVLEDTAEHQQLLQREKELALMKKETELMQKYSADLKDLIDVAAHELRHPAAMFRGYTRILLQGADEMNEGEKREILLDMDRATDRLTHVANLLLDASQIERGEIHLNYQEISPMELLKRAAEDVRARGGAKNFKVGPCAEHSIRVDPLRLESVLSIILDNAVKHSGDSGEIEIWCENRGPETVFLVADRGPGIPQEYRDLVFERFFQVSDAIHHSTPGIGLGLSIAKRFVEAHNGWIRVDPRENGGSIFSFGVPTNGLKQVSA